MKNSKPQVGQKRPEISTPPEFISPISLLWSIKGFGGNGGR
jgi:hypothetical protein